ncbi:MAG: hypothetical protein E7352_01455 [Clostridiales bacterium]|nr:hypothetical protein [Clostridiales bacterium]
MKLFKKLAAACLALTFCFGLATLVACGDKGGVTPPVNSSSPVDTNSDSNDESSAPVDTDSDSEGNDEGSDVVAKENAYNFLIRNADGSAAVGYAVQMCTTDGSGICYAPSNAIGNISDENGFVYVEMGSMSCPNPAVYEVHVMLDGAQVNLSSVVNTPAEASLELIVVTLA